MSKVFEFHFNPLNENCDSFFETFCYLPRTRKEKVSGALCLIGKAKEKESLFNLAERIKNAFYYNSFDNALSEANSFLREKPLLNNLHFAIISFSPFLNIQLSKIGEIKIILLRKGQAFDLSSNLSFSESFPSMIEGQLQKGDKILSLTKDVFDSFKREKILERLSEVKKPKQVKQIFKEKKKILKEFSGCCFLCFPKKKRFFFGKKNKPYSSKLEKLIISFLILVIILLLGYIFF